MTPPTFGWSQGQQDHHGVDHQDVHGGGLPGSPAQEHLVLGLGLENNNNENNTEKKKKKKKKVSYITE